MKLKPSAQKIFSLFKKHYKLVPLEVFGNDPYKTLISTILSSRTKDTTTLIVSKKLFQKAPNVYVLNKLSAKDIQKLIYPVGFYRTKSGHLNKLAKIIVEEKNGNIPNTLEGLLNLPGVGRKTANLVLNRSFDFPAIAVDTHVHRITNIIGWVNTSSPEETEMQLIKILPKKYWSDVNRLFVSIGQQFTSKKKLTKFLQENELLHK